MYKAGFQGVVVVVIVVDYYIFVLPSNLCLHCYLSSVDAKIFWEQAFHSTLACRVDQAWLNTKPANVKAFVRAGSLYFVLELLWLGLQVCRESDSKYLQRESQTFWISYLVHISPPLDTLVSLALPRVSCPTNPKTTQLNFWQLY